MDRESEPTSYGIPLSVAYDSDSDPNNRASDYVLEPYSYTDHAAQVVRIAQKRLTAEYGDDALDHRVFGVKQVPRPPVAPTGG
jgi:hypothetical protein